MPNIWFGEMESIGEKLRGTHVDNERAMIENTQQVGGSAYAIFNTTFHAIAMMVEDELRDKLREFVLRG